MFNKLKLLTLSFASIIFTSTIALPTLQLNNSSREITNIISTRETKTANEFISEISSYDWEANDYIFELEYDIDFTGFDPLTTSPLTLDNTSSERYVFNGNGHKFLNKEQTIPKFGDGSSYDQRHYLTNSNVSRQYLFSSVSNVDFYDLAFENFNFFIDQSTNNTFTDVAFTNLNFNNFLFNKSPSAGIVEENALGLWIGTMDTTEIKNLVIQDINISSGIIRVAGEVAASTENNVYIAPIGTVKNSLSIDGLFINNVSYEDFSFSNNNYTYNGKILLSDLYGKGTELIDLSLKNVYVGETSYKRITAFSTLFDKNYALIGGDSNALTNVELEDIVLDNTVTSDIVSGDQNYINFIETSFAYDASQIFISENDNITYYSDNNSDNFNLEDSANFVTRQEIYEFSFIYDLLGDVDFIYLENNENPRAIIDSIEIQIINEEQSLNFATVDDSIDYQAKTLFQSWLNSDDYKIAIANSNEKLLKEQVVKSSDTVSANFNKIKDKSIVVYDAQNNEIIFSMLIWESNALYILWVLLIVLAILVLIILLIILLLILSKSRDTRLIQEYNDDLNAEIQLLGESPEQRQVIVFDPDFNAENNDYSDQDYYEENYSNQEYYDNDYYDENQLDDYNDSNDYQEDDYGYEENIDLEDEFGDVLEYQDDYEEYL